MSRTHEPSRINQNQLGGGKSNRRQVKRAATSQRMWGGGGGTRPTRGWNPREVERMLLRWVERSGEKQSSAPRWSGRMNSSLSSRLRALLCSCARGHRFSLFSSGFVRLNPPPPPPEHEGWIGRWSVVGTLHPTVERVPVWRRGEKMISYS